jgi:hypothetical protein
MNYNDHDPPYFHARYQEWQVSVEIGSGAVTGTMPRRALQMVLDWLAAHRNELQADWQLARQRRPLQPIAPLD